MNDSATTVSQAQVAVLAGTTKAAVTQWRQRHDFPAPVDGDRRRFNLDDVIGWLDGRRIPADKRTPDEAAGATYGDRARRRRPTDRSDTGSPVRSLLAHGPKVCGDAPLSDYLYLLFCLAYLFLHDKDRWAQLSGAVPSSGDPGDARRLLQLVVAAVDGSLGASEHLRHADAPPTRLRPPAFEPVRKVMELVANLAPSDFGRLRDAYVREVCATGGAICTPTGIARTMVALLSSDTAHGDVTVHDPFARFGELAAELLRNCADPAAVRVEIANPNPAELRLAGMWVTAADAHAELAITSSPPPGRADYVLANPPFGQKTEPEWLERCVASLTEGGSAAVLMPYGVGFRTGARARDVRRDLVKNGAVRAVVALPAQMFLGTNVGVCIWLLQHPAGQPAPVLLVDARRLGRKTGARSLRHVLDPEDIATIAKTVAASVCQPGFSVLVSPDEIRANGYSLHPPEYQDRTLAPTAPDTAREELDTLSEDLTVPSYTTGRDEGWPMHRLGDVCNIRTGIPASSLERALSRATAAREVVPVVYPRHLRDGLIDRDDAPDADVAALDEYRLRTGDVLWVRTGAMGKTAVVRPGESGWLQHTNLLRLRVTDTAKLDPAYLLTYLSQAAVLARIKERSVRSLTTSLSMATFKDFEIPLPPLAEQHRILTALHSIDEQMAAFERLLNASRAARTAFARHLTDGTVILTEGETR